MRCFIDGLQYNYTRKTHGSTLYFVGLFSQVIAHSGSALAPWAISKNPVGIARKFGSKLDCNSTSSGHLALCLKSKDVKDIVMAQLQLIV